MALIFIYFYAKGGMQNMIIERTISIRLAPNNLSNTRRTQAKTLSLKILDKKRGLKKISIWLWIYDM